MEMLRSPRFHSRVIVPPVPNGFVLVKFYGLPLFIPAAQPEDEQYGKSPYTIVQANYLFTVRGILMDRLVASPPHVGSGWTIPAGVK